MILNIRGTHGSGKSTLVRGLLHRGNTSPLGSGKRPEGYITTLPKLASPIYVIGSYETTCGGCDAIQPYSLIWPRIVEYAARGHVVFEGALISSSYGNIGRSSEVYGDGFVFAFLDTPLEECLRRIAKRREARGDVRPLDPKNTTVKYNNVQRSITKIQNEFGRRVVILKHQIAQLQVMLLLKEGDRARQAQPAG